MLEWLILDPLLIVGGDARRVPIAGPLDLQVQAAAAGVAEGVAEMTQGTSKALPIEVDDFLIVRLQFSITFRYRF